MLLGAFVILSYFSFSFIIFQLVAIATFIFSVKVFFFFFFHQILVLYCISFKKIIIKKK